MRQPAPLRALSLCALLLLGCQAAGEPARRLTIVHVNDLHARLVPDDRGRGGFAHVAGAIERECATAEVCVVLDAGDLVQGSAVSSVFRGVAIFDVANGLGLDASTLGNHEFDYGWERIPEFLETADFPVVSANVTGENGELLADAPYVVLERGGIRLGVIGVLTEGLPFLTVPDNYEPWTVRPVVETVRALLPEVARQADLVVVLGHLDDEEERALVAGVEGIAAVVSGHGHEGLERPLVVDGRLVVRVRGYGREVGRLDLVLDGGSSSVAAWEWRAIPVRAAEIEAVPRVAERVAHWEGKLSEAIDLPIGRSARALGHGEVRRLLERVLRETTGADLGYVNPGGVRDTLPEGPLTARHVWNVMPFDNHVVVGEFRGRELPRSLVEERELDPERTYRLATMDFVATMWNRSRSRKLVFEDTERLVRDAALEWIREAGVLE